MLLRCDVSCSLYMGESFPDLADFRIFEGRRGRFRESCKSVEKIFEGGRVIFCQKIIFIQFFKLEKEQYYDLKRNYVKTFYFKLNFIGDFVTMERKTESLYFHKFTSQREITRFFFLRHTGNKSNSDSMRFLSLNGLVNLKSHIFPGFCPVLTRESLVVPTTPAVIFRIFRKIHFHP